jgi:hypothetical protein
MRLGVLTPGESVYDIDVFDKQNNPILREVGTAEKDLENYVGKEVAQKTASRQGNAARDQKKAEKEAFDREVLRIAEVQRKSALAKLERKKIEKQRSVSAGKVSVGNGSLKGASSEETKESGNV